MPATSMRCVNSSTAANGSRSRQMARCPATAKSPAWWKTRPTKLGDECDGLAVSGTGEVLAIEVRPHTASDKDIPWSVLQAGMCADLFQRRADQVGGAHEVLHDMAAKRSRIGLAPSRGILLAAPITVRPVVALGRRATSSARAKLADVRAHLISAGLATDLDVRQVNLVGRLKLLA
jgi:hypothetical protein